MKINNKGFGSKEIMIGILVVVAGMGIMLYKTTKIDDGKEFKNFKTLTKTFIADAGKLRDEVAVFEDRVFYYDALTNNASELYKNPFDSSTTCDEYESKLVMKNNVPFVTFKCGDYIIQDQRTSNDKYTIYKVSEWTDKELEGDNVEAQTFYGLEVDGKNVLNGYFSEKEFLVKYSDYTKSRTLTLAAVEPGYTVVKKVYFRTLEKVDEI